MKELRTFVIDVRRVTSIYSAVKPRLQRSAARKASSPTPEDKFSESITRTLPIGNNLAGSCALCMVAESF
jgi:hypothetical protein